MAEYDNRIPEKLQLLRVGLGGKDELSVFAFYPSEQQTNFANPSFCLAPASDYPETMDVTGAIEQTLHDLLDYGGTEKEIMDFPDCGHAGAVFWAGEAELLRELTGAGL